MRTLALVFHPDLEGASRASKALAGAARGLPVDAGRCYRGTLLAE
ncbi:hypothetical protein [Bifidobacterium sp. CP2]|nr:hypothetical protein [Bifidobacterium sp. CP2]